MPSGQRQGKEIYGSCAAQRESISQHVVPQPPKSWPQLQISLSINSSSVYCTDWQALPVATSKPTSKPLMCFTQEKAEKPAMLYESQDLIHCVRYVGVWSMLTVDDSVPACWYFRRPEP